MCKQLINCCRTDLEELFCKFTVRRPEIKCATNLFHKNVIKMNFGYFKRYDSGRPASVHPSVWASIVSGGTNTLSRGRAAFLAAEAW